MKRHIFWIALFGFLILGTISNSAFAIPIRSIANIDTITFWERTGLGPAPYIFDTEDLELRTRLVDPLTATNSDFFTTAMEFYDVYYSNSDGTFNVDGEYISIEAVFNNPNDSGLNLARVDLNFTGILIPEFANQIGSFSSFGNFSFPGTVGNAIDGDTDTHTLMGETSGSTDRLRVTVGFESSVNSGSGTPIPEPSTSLLFGLGLTWLAMINRKKF